MRLLLMLNLLIGTVFADEVGGALHDESCLACHIFEHDADFYTRETRKITNLLSLAGQVSRCSQAFSVGWFPDEEKSVVDYLNQQYYIFKK